VLAGCDEIQQASGGSVHGSAVPPPSGQQTPAAHLRSKITLIERDPCFSDEPRADVTRCAGRYSAQVGGVAQAAVREASGTSEPGKVRHAARALQQASGTLQSCNATTSRCASELAAVDARLSALESALAGHATSRSSAPPSHG
jgi:hypothetical protein